jgi:predicted DNA-binding transcriptional regulator AlpA
MELSKRMQQEQRMERTDTELMSSEGVRAYFGGLSRVTLWRYVRAGKIPAPIKFSNRLSRWLRSECEQARQKMIDARNADQ